MAGGLGLQPLGEALRLDVVPGLWPCRLDGGSALLPGAGEEPRRREELPRADPGEAAGVWRDDGGGDAAAVRECGGAWDGGTELDLSGGEDAPPPSPLPEAGPGEADRRGDLFAENSLTLWA